MRTFIIVSAVVAFVAPVTAQDPISIFTTQNQAAFTASLNASPAHYLETFNGNGVLAAGNETVPFTGPSPDNHFSFDVTAVGGTYRSGIFFGTWVDQTALTLTPTSGNINAVGGNFFVTNDGDVFQSGQTFTITVTNAANQTLTSAPITLTSASDYISIHSPNSNITSIVMSATTSAIRFNSIDNITVGVSPVPEPTLILAGFAGLALVVGRVRRRFEPVLAA